MRVSHHHRTQLMQGAILVSIISALILWGYREWTKPFGQDDLKIDVSDLRSHISEGQRITEQASSGTVTSPYFKSQILMLVDKTEEVQKQLEDAKPVPDLELKLWEVRHLSGQVKSVLEQLSTSLSNQRELKRIHKELGEFNVAVRKMEASLKQ